MTKQTYYLWRVKDQFGFIIRTGISIDFCDVLVDDIVNNYNDLRDRSLSEMQDFIDEYYPDLNIKFEYKQTEIDFEKW